VIQRTVFYIYIYIQYQVGPSDVQTLPYQVGDIQNQLLDMVFGDDMPAMHLFFTYVQSESDASHVFGHYNVVAPVLTMQNVDSPLLLPSSDAR